MQKITAHTIVKNEENWIKYSLLSVKDLVTKILVFDDGSSDRTVKIVQSIGDPKIEFFSKELKTPADHTKLRNEMIKMTKTEWFLILDGDEVWNKTTFEKLLTLIEKCPKNVYGVVVRTRNCVGDVFHYLPESDGKYELLGKRGNFNIRAYRKIPGFSWKGDYPNEAYCDARGKPINNQNDHLAFFDDYYWHMTFLPRSSARDLRKHAQNYKLALGIKALESDLPEVMKNGFWPRRGALYWLMAAVSDLLRKFR
jgi:glycosyltransferase involved in cell wall biosynthesis